MGVSNKKFIILSCLLCPFLIFQSWEVLMIGILLESILIKIITSFKLTLSLRSTWNNDVFDLILGKTNQNVKVFTSQCLFGSATSNTGAGWVYKSHF